MARVPWEKKFKVIQEQYPNVLSEDWSKLFREDSDIFAKILGDVLKLKGRESIPGKRPSLSRAEAESRLAKIADEDFSELEFKDALNALKGTRSIRNLANKVDLSPSYVQRLLNGSQEPSFETMEIIAKAFNKDPSYFLEYRVARVLVHLDSFLRSSPETASFWYLKVTGQ